MGNEISNRKVADNRGEKWRRNLRAGRLSVQLNPSKLRIKRMSEGFTQDQLAKLIEVSLPTYCAIDKGDRTIKESAVKKICDALKIKKYSEFFYKDSKGKWRAIKNTISTDQFGKKKK